MYKKTLTVGLLFIMFIQGIVPAVVFAEESKGSSLDLAPNSQSAVLMDADTGTLIFEKNSDVRLPPASITKVMTMLLIMEAIDNGSLQWNEKVSTSEHAASMGGSQIFLEAGEEMTVDDMFKGIAMASGNDASVAMAEKIAGSEELFVQQMNDKAKQLGLKNTSFANTNGLPAENHYSSAYDIAVMSRELLHYEKVTEYTGKYEDYLRKDTDDPFWLVNTNKLVRFYSGVDGLKTGYTSKAKFCLTATAKRDGFRVISVVLGEPNTKTRNLEVSKMFDYAFSQYKVHPIFQAGDKIESIKIDKGSVPEIELSAQRQYSVLLKKGESAENIRYETEWNEDLQVPIKKGQEIAKLKVYNEDEMITEFSLPAPEDVEKAGWWKLLKRTTGKIFWLD